MPLSAVANTRLSALSLHDALPISRLRHPAGPERERGERHQRHGPVGVEREGPAVGRGRLFTPPQHHERLAELVPRLGRGRIQRQRRSEEHTSELQSLAYLVCRSLLWRTPDSPLFPYTTLFRSLASATRPARSESAESDISAMGRLGSSAKDLR